MALESFLPLAVELGLLAGLAVAISGYIQEYSKGEKREKFSIDKFTLTIIIGAGVGGAMAFVSNIDYAVSLFLINAGIVAIVGSLVRAILRLK